MKFPLKVLFLAFSISTAVLTASCVGFRTSQEPTNEPTTNESVETESVENEIEDNNQSEDKDDQLTKTTQTDGLSLQNDATVNEEDEYGTAPLMRAAQEGNLDRAKLLIEHKADVNAKDINGETALSMAGTHDHSKVVEILDGKQAKPPPQVENNTKDYSKAGNKQEPTTTTATTSAPKAPTNTPSPSETTDAKNGNPKQYPEKSVGQNRQYTKKPNAYPNDRKKTERNNAETTSGGILDLVLRLAALTVILVLIPFLLRLFLDRSDSENPPPSKSSEPHKVTTNTETKETLQNSSEPAKEHHSEQPTTSDQRERTFDRSPINISEGERWRTVEANVHNELIKLPPEYNVMSNALFRRGRYSTQIDHIVTSTHGMFIVETKSWRGKISGNENDEEWTQNINGISHKLYNPILQNKGHISFLRRIFRDKGFGFLLPTFRSIIVFEDDAKLSVNTKYEKDIVHRNTLLNTILGYKDLIVTDGEREKTEEAIEISVEANQEAEKQHVKNVKIIQILKKIGRTGLCPICDNQLKWKGEDNYQHWICSNCKFDSRTSLEEIANNEVERIFALPPNDALISAVNSEDFEISEYLISRGGADPNARTSDDSSTLLCAVKNNYWDITKLLLEHGADPNEKTEKGVTPFMWAIKNNRKDIAELLLQHGADIDARRDGGPTAFIWAMKEKETNYLVATFLLQNNANIDAKDENGYTTLMWAASSANLDVIKFLLQNNANINATGTNGYNPLICASMNGHLNTVKLLIKNHAAVDAKGEETVTAFVWAMKKAYLNIASFLLARNANIDAKDENGYTTLMWAANMGNVAFVQFLLEHGANAIAKNKYGETPLRLAARSKTNILRKIETILFILAYATKPTV